MEREAYFDSGEWAVFPGHDLTSVDIQALNPTDEVVIRTANSTYSFLVTDPDKRHGILTGGKLGNSARQALVIESVGLTHESDTEGDAEGNSGLRIGNRVLFYLISLGRPELVMTSGIQRLGVIPGQNGDTVQLKQERSNGPEIASMGRIPSSRLS